MITRTRVLLGFEKWIICSHCELIRKLWRESERRRHFFLSKPAKLQSSGGRCLSRREREGYTFTWTFKEKAWHMHWSLDDLVVSRLAVTPIKQKVTTMPLEWGENWEKGFLGLNCSSISSRCDGQVSESGRASRAGPRLFSREILRERNFWAEPRRRREAGCTRLFTLSHQASWNF